jgi:isopentenyl-diphosphate delta-isomerase
MYLECENMQIGTDYVVLVDELDNKIGLQEKQQAHIEGALHRAFSVFILNPKQQILLQQRQSDKYHCANMWTNTCCSHPRDEESIVVAARRRLFEEMNIDCANLKVVDSFVYKAALDTGLIEHEYDYVLIGYLDQDTIDINPVEVQSYRWVEVAQLQAWMHAEPENFTPWFNLAFAKLLQWLEKHPS